MRRRRLPTALVLALAVTVLAPAASGATNVEMEILPQVPTWHDRVTVTVRGMSGCSVEVSQVELGHDAEIGPVVDIFLGESCLVSLPPQLFELQAEVGRLPVDTHTVRVIGGSPDSVLAEQTLVVHEHADVIFSPRAEPADDTAPFGIGLVSFESGCSTATLAEVTAQTIVVEWPDICPLLPPEPRVVQDEVEVGPLAAGDYEIRVYRSDVDPAENPAVPLARSSVHVYDADLCVPSDTALCLNDDRFRVTVHWRDFKDREGEGMTLPLRDDTGLFWFFHPDNAELTVKVLDGCGVNGRYWVFVASGSTVEYEIEVTDTLADETRTYRNDLRQTPALIADTGAFASCP